MCMFETISSRLHVGQETPSELMRLAGWMAMCVAQPSHVATWMEHVSFVSSSQPKHGSASLFSLHRESKHWPAGKFHEFSAGWSVIVNLILNIYVYSSIKILHSHSGAKTFELSHYLQLQWTINSRKLHKINVHLCISCWWTTLFDCFLHRNGPGSIFQGRATQSQLVYRQILTRENKYISVTNKISICFRYWQKLRPFAQRNL